MVKSHSPRGTAPAAAPPVSSPWPDLAACAWVVAFLLVFFSQELPNNRPIVRKDLWPLLPFVLMDAVDPPQEPNGPPQGWAYLPQRLPLWGVAALIGGGAWGLGLLALSRLPLATLSPGERHALAALLGLGLVSLIVLGLGLAGVMSSLVLIGVLSLSVVAGIVVARRQRSPVAAAETESVPFWRTWWWVVVAAPFFAAIALGAVSPSTDFDVNEYHLGGPKEWFLQGRITFLPHNVYTSFPCLTEMLLLAGMVVTGDWYWGGVAGQAVLALFAPLTAWNLWHAGRRWWSPHAGALAAVIYLSTPWVLRMSAIAYAEGGLTAYVCATLCVGLVALEALRKNDSATRRDSAGLILLTGLCAGAAFACKYPGLLFAVAPWAVALGVAAWRSPPVADESPGRAWRALSRTWLLYGAGLAALAGPWLLKNLIETGNPVYPLAYHLFGGFDLDEALAAKWARGHATPKIQLPFGFLAEFARQAFDVAAKNDWQSPLVFGFAPLTWLAAARDERRRAGRIWLATGWLFLMWFLFAHDRIDRFWLPLLPPATLLAGMGATVCQRRWSRVVVGLALAAGLFFNLGVSATGLVGYNAGLKDLRYASDFASRKTGPEIAWMNVAWSRGALPRDFKLLCVGEAQLFHARFPYLYNTVFDRSLLEEWCAAPAEAAADERRALRPPAEIRATLAARGVTHVFVNWGEILRYRRTYGYTDFVRPAVFRELQSAGVLGPPLAWPEELGVRPAESLSDDELQELSRWAPELIGPCAAGRCLTTSQLFPVLPSRESRGAHAATDAVDGHAP